MTLRENDGPIDWCVVDVETTCMAVDVGGFGPLLGGAPGPDGNPTLAIAVTWDSQTGEYTLWDRHTVEGLADYLWSFPVVVTFNGDRFDLPFLAGQTAASNLRIQQSLDLFELMKEAFQGPRKGSRLGQTAERTLGRGKILSGGPAGVALWHEGRIAELVGYCKQDVALTRDLMLYALEHGTLEGPDGTVNLTFPEWAKRLRRNPSGILDVVH